ncbi:MAG: LamG-like jellyroll fold domain-containing protein, partial [Verrucomicrobiota bacterium]
MTETLVEDSSWPPNDAVSFEGTVTNMPGLVGTGQFFDDGFIRIGNQENFNMQEAMTVSAWVRVDGGWRDTWQGFVSKRGEADEGWQIRRFGGADFGTFTLRGTLGVDDPTGVLNIGDGQWHHLVGTFDGSVRRLFVDGQIDIEIIDTGLISLTTFNNEVEIGSRDGGAGRHRGMIDEVQVIDRGVSPEWVRTAYVNTDPNRSFFCFSRVDAASAPRVSNAGGATSVSGTNATVNGSLIADPSPPSTVWLFWGTVDGGFDTNAWANGVDLGVQPVGPLSVMLTNLTTNTAYYYTYYAFNTFGDTWAPSSVLFQTFGPPDVMQTGPMNLSVGSADLSGVFLTPNRGGTTIYWGDGDGGTDSSAWANTNHLGSVTTATFSVSVSNLLYGVGYYYRIFSTNSSGAAWASTSTAFKTRKPILSGPGGLLATQYDTIEDAANLAPIRLLQGMPFDGTSVQMADIQYNNNIVPAFPFITDVDSFSLLWEAVFIPDAGAGIYTFGLDSDDRSVLYIDLNRDGDFDDPGEFVLDRPCCGNSVNTVVLDADPYIIAIG